MEHSGSFSKSRCDWNPSSGAMSARAPLLGHAEPARRAVPARWCALLSRARSACSARPSAPRRRAAPRAAAPPLGRSRRPLRSPRRSSSRRRARRARHETVRRRQGDAHRGLERRRRRALRGQSTIRPRAPTARVVRDAAAVHARARVRARRGRGEQRDDAHAVAPHPRRGLHGGALLRRGRRRRRRRRGRAARDGELRVADDGRAALRPAAARQRDGRVAARRADGRDRLRRRRRAARRHARRRRDRSVERRPGGVHVRDRLPGADRARPRGLGRVLLGGRRLALREEAARDPRLRVPARPRDRVRAARSSARLLGDESSAPSLASHQVLANDAFGSTQLLTVDAARARSRASASSTARTTPRTTTRSRTSLRRRRPATTRARRRSGC